MAIGTDPEFFNFSVSSSQTPPLIVTDGALSTRKTQFHSGKILKPKRSSSLNLVSKSILAHFRQPEFLSKHGVLTNPYFKSDLKTVHNSNMNGGMENVCLERKLRRDYTNHGFDHTLLVEENMLPSEVDSLEKPNSRFNSPIDDVTSRSSKSPNSIEDLNKEIERLFLNNEKFEFTSFIWDAEEIAGGRRAPIADMLHCCKGFRTNRRKKRRIATALAIRNYNESDSSNGISSPDDYSGCEEYTENTLIENLDPPIIVPVPGKSGVDQLQALNISGPFSGNKLQLSEGSAFAPINSIQRSQSTPPQSTNTIDILENENKMF